jgi:L-lactate dehydrogenase complex protein LldE
MVSSSQPRVALFVTCLVDLFRPSIGFAAVRLLEAAGCRVEVPRGQTCCGQPSQATITWSRHPAPAPAC